MATRDLKKLIWKKMVVNLSAEKPQSVQEASKKVHYLLCRL